MATDGKNPDPGRGSLTPEEREALRQRASELGKRLDEVHARKLPPAGNARSRGTALGEAFKIVAELMVGVVVGGGVGWALDRALGSAPWLMMLFLILGFAAGLSNVVRTARKMQAASEPMQRNAPSVADDEEDEGRTGKASGTPPGKR
jgi:ATP synthase protein I